ncbi:aminopeptidase N-like isoform X2 [Pollicipes pollicipes]|nr:aminopeptidase N-like isoform X2 [Pollicipes pollicipes]
MASHEELTMDSGHEAVTFSKASGCFVTRCCALLLLLLFAVALLVTGLLVHRYGAPCQQTPSDAGSQGGPAAPPDGGGTAAKIRDVRLPRHLAPEAYQVRLLPFIEEGNFTFSGEVTIRLRADHPGRNVTVHVNDMTVFNDSVTVTDVAEARGLEVAGYRYDTDREFFVVVLAEDVQPGRKYDVYIRFVGNLNDKLAGFYRSSYETPQGEKRWMAVTQFQPTDARKAFPCLDEPALKATFEMTLGRPKRMTSASNMPIRMTVQNDKMPGFEWDIYEKSVPMSTYLVAFLVSDLAVKQAEPGLSDTLFRVWARSAAIEQGDYARAIGPAILEYFEDFFKTEFPLPKQDMAALPDFAAGAMENWGLITYRETALLYDPKLSSWKNKQRVAQVVAHELAHQWFGNLVTPSWWTDLWLNEGFASYMEFLGMHQVEPTWRVMEQFITSQVQHVMTMDALESSHPISIVVQHPDEIGQIFDRISYQKGASIIRMMDLTLSTDTLRNGLANYLADRKYQAADQDDLWHFLTEQAHRDGTLPSDTTVKQVMDTWTLQMGFPLVDVRRNYERNSAQLTQNRFLFHGANSSAEYLWWVPLVYTTQSAKNFNSTRPSQWMKKERQVTLNDVASAEQWMILNVQEMGYFKVNYDERNWLMLIKQLQDDHNAIHAVNRAQLIDDSLDLARAGQLKYETALAVISYLERENDFLPWDAAFENLEFLDSQLERTPGYGAFQRFVLKLIEPLYARIGFDEGPGDSHLDHLTRSSLLTWACGMGHAECRRSAVQKFQQWMANPADASIVPPNIKTRVYCTALEEGGVEEWEFAWRQYQKSNVASERQRLLFALGCSKSVWILNRYLNYLVTPNSDVRIQDGPQVFNSVATGSVQGRYLAFDFLRNHWDTIDEIYGSAIFSLPRFIAPLKEGYNTRLDLEQLQEFKRKNEANMGEANRAMDQAIEHATANVAWMDKNYDSIVRWLEQQQ